MPLWEHQVRQFAGVKTAFSEGKKRVVLASPTGSGKSYVAMAFIKGALEKGKTVHFYTDRITLVDQFAKDVHNAGIEDFGIMQADNPYWRPGCPFQIITPQTMSRRNIKKPDLAIWDEAHVLYRSLLHAMKEWEGTYWVGLTATPFARGMGKYWQGIVNGTNAAELIEAGHLSDWEAFGPTEEIDLTGVGGSGDFNKKELSKRNKSYKKRVGLLVENWFDKARDLKTVCMAVDIADADDIAVRFKLEGIDVGVIHSKMPHEDTVRNLKMFQDGGIQLLVSVDMVSRGFHQTDTACQLIARSTKSLIWHYQSIGRILGASQGKDKAIYLDHAGNFNRIYERYGASYPTDELDMELDDGKERGERKPKLKKERTQLQCPSCKKYILSGNVCPDCEIELKRTAHVTEVFGSLEQLSKDRKTKNRKTSKENKEKLYAKLLAGAQAAGYQSGWAAHKYRERFGVWPNAYGHVKPDDKFLQFLKTQPDGRKVRIVWSLVKK